MAEMKAAGMGGLSMHSPDDIRSMAESQVDEDGDDLEEYGDSELENEF